MLSPQEREWLKAVYGLAFRIIDRHAVPTLDQQGLVLCLTVRSLDLEAIEQLAFPILYTLASLSFCEARPDNYNETTFSTDDHLTLPEFLQTLGSEQGRLTWYGDTIKGRRVNTELCIQPTGELLIQTVGRGAGPDFWLRFIQGEQQLQVVPALKPLTPLKPRKARLKKQ